jgi:phosphohistidine phosphatase
LNLFLWRHAEAEEGHPDLSRVLTERGRAQAATVGHWIRRTVKGDAEILVSPARRTRQTADALGLPYRIEERLAPGAQIEDITAVLSLQQAMPQDKHAQLVVVGHQPWVGELAAHLVSGKPSSWSVRKAQVWWLMWRMRGAQPHWTVRAVVDADTL